MSKHHWPHSHHFFNNKTQVTLTQPKCANTETDNHEAKNYKDGTNLYKKYAKKKKSCFKSFFKCHHAVLPAPAYVPPIRCF